MTWWSLTRMRQHLGLWGLQHSWAEDTTLLFPGLLAGQTWNTADSRNSVPAAPGHINFNGHAWEATLKTNPFSIVTVTCHWDL